MKYYIDTIWVVMSQATHEEKEAASFHSSKAQSLRWSSLEKTTTIAMLSFGTSLMKFDLRKPCSGCPFLKVGGVKHLRPERVREIAGYMTSSQGASFPCHKTTTHGDEDDVDEFINRDKEQHCAGALLFMEKTNPGGNQIARISERLGIYDASKLQGHDLVFDNVEDMVKGHENPQCS